VNDAIRVLRLTILVLVAATLALASCAQEAQPPLNQLTEEEAAQGYILLFDGQTLDGWATTGNRDGWTVENGAILNRVQGGGYLYRADLWDNYVLCLDFMVDAGTNSGVFFRWKDLGNDLTGIEMQVLDSAAANPPSKWDCGSIYDIIAPSRNTMKPSGEWNTAKIVAVDSLITVYLNGEPISGMDLSRWTEAGKNPDGTGNKFPVAYATLVGPSYIGLQDHGSPVRYRNIKIKPLVAGEGPAETAPPAP